MSIRVGQGILILTFTEGGHVVFKTKGIEKEHSIQTFPLILQFYAYFLPIGRLEVQILTFWKVVLLHIKLKGKESTTIFKPFNYLTQIPEF